MIKDIILNPNEQVLRRAIVKVEKDGFRGLCSSVCSKAYRRLSLFPRIGSVYVEPTNHCNLRCEMCFSNDRAKGFMSLDFFTDIIDQLPSGTNVMLNLGGEPLLHPRFLDMAAYACDSRNVATVQFYTNGTLLDYEVSQCIVSLGLDRVTISLDGLAKQNNAIRIGSSYEQIEQNIMALMKVRGKRKKPSVEINLTKSCQSDKEIMDFLDVWVPRVDCVHVQPVQSNLGQVDKTFFDQPFKLHSHCNVSFYSTIIAWNGDVLSCCGDLQGLNALGNLHNNSLMEVWKGERYRKFRECQKANYYPANPRCANCDVWKYHLKYRRINHGAFTLTMVDNYKNYESKCSEVPESEAVLPE